MKKNILIVVSSYYPEISNNLVLGATNFFDSNIDLIEYGLHSVSGSFEIPFIIHKNRDLYDGFLALGSIIRGQTYHFEIISNEVTRKIMDLSIEINKPIGFGILTCENLKQARARSNPNKINKGGEAAKACAELLYSKRF